MRQFFPFQTEIAQSYYWAYQETENVFQLADKYAIFGRDF
jgi:hypothetical protein